MPSDLQIAENVLAACLEAGHKPGKIQFTKYLYLLDYCHWHFTGGKATSLPWKFYHYGPWCEPVEDCMSGLASRYEFKWWEHEAAFVRSVEIARQPLDITARSLITQIVGMFKDRDLNVLLEITYSQTEPMVDAKRGDRLDFSRIPVDKQMPVFFPSASQRATDFQLHPERQKKMVAFQARAEALKEKAKRRMEFRESGSYQKAVSLLAEEFAAPDTLPEMSGAISLDAADGMSTG